MNNDNVEDSSDATDRTNTTSSTKLNSSTKEEEDPELFPPLRPRTGMKSKINNYQAGRATVSVPITKFSGISHNASFQSKLLFFNGGKPYQKFQHIPHNNEKEETNKKEHTGRKSVLLGDDVNKITNTEEIDNNININKIIEKKNNNKEASKKVSSRNDSFLSIQNQIRSLSFENKAANYNNNLDIEKIESPFNLKLKTMKDQWSFQKILLDYNILDFTSKKKFFYNFHFSDI